MDRKQRWYRQWLLRAGIGLALTGMGASFIAEAAMLKYGGAEVWSWVAAGTGALCVFNTGLSVFGSAIIYRLRYERASENVADTP